MRRRLGWLLALAPLCAFAQSSSPEQGEQRERRADAAQVAPPPAASGPPRELVSGMLRVPGGRFVFGRQRGEGAGDERPTHALGVRAFWLDRTEVTVGAYRACVAVGACSRPQTKSAHCTFTLGDDTLPVNCVRFTDAQAYCRWRGARLPSEREWEFAAKGGPADRRYPWGDVAASCEVAATLRSDHTAQSCTGSRPAPVGSHPGGQGAYGHQDLAGNLEEWTADYYSEPLPATPPRAGASHVLRGGSWLLGPAYARSTARSAGSSMEAGPGVGFRCAKDG